MAISFWLSAFTAHIQRLTFPSIAAVIKEMTIAALSASSVAHVPISTEAFEIANILNTPQEFQTISLVDSSQEVDLIGNIKKARHMKAITHTIIKDVTPTEDSVVLMPVLRIGKAEIKRVLIECIKLIINLKQQVTNLVRFFKAMEALVEMCIKFQVEPFLQTVNAIVAADGTDPNKDLKIGDYTYTDFQRSQLYSAAVTMRAYFGVFGDIAKMWVQLSKDSIMPGLRMCDELSVTVDDKDGAAQMRRKIADLNQWSTDAVDRVKKIAQEKQQAIMDGMQSRIDEVAETTKQITPLPEPTVKAITAGTEVTKQAALTHITEKAEKSPFSRFVISDD
ncbi:hypothetical protein N0V85_008717 [Neurospora sp. IMI 360204]|nr:hypothetical protein N0V85_008717 [Neurospora sp. IMI 360204]